MRKSSQLQREQARQILDNNQSFYVHPITSQKILTNFYTFGGEDKDGKIFEQSLEFSKEFVKFLYGHVVIAPREKWPKRNLPAVETLWTLYYKKRFRELLDLEDFCNFLILHQNDPVMLAYQLQGTQFDNDKEKVALILNGSKKISEYQEELANSLKTYLSQYINFPETKELLKKISKDMHLLCEFNRGIKILENYNKLTEHNIQRILKHPNEFFKSYQILKRHDLESKAYNLQSIVDDPKKFMNCYHILEKLGLISKEFLIYMLYHPNFPKVYGTLGKSGFNQTGHIRVILEFQINKKSTTIDTDKFIEIFKILKEYGLDKEKKYFKIACESQGEFENNFNHLKNIGLANRKYVQAVLEHQDLYRMFKSMLGGSVEPKYVSAILDGPLQSEKNLKNFLTLFSPVAPQPEYIKKMLDHPGGFGIVFNALKNSKYRLITFPKESIENALNNIEQFARICSNLNEHLYSGYINHRKILENLDQFERNYERLKKSGLENWSQLGLTH